MEVWNQWRSLFLWIILQYLGLPAVCTFRICFQVLFVSHEAVSPVDILTKNGCIFDRGSINCHPLAVIHHEEGAPDLVN
jgi:hypothetical protein